MAYRNWKIETRKWKLYIDVDTDMNKINTDKYE